MGKVSYITDVQSYTLNEIRPTIEEIAISMGIDKGVKIPDEVMFLIEGAMELFDDLAKPIGIIKVIDEHHFLEISEGGSQVEKRYPLQGIIPKANMLALFAFTLGEKISNEIQQLINKKDYPLGYALDIIASRSAEQATVVQEKRFVKNTNTTSVNKALLYSPGYCGWDITAQQRIFQYLEPHKIGIELNENSLMYPIKSVSGILIIGEPEIHRFKSNFSFCRSCTTHSCRERMKI